MAPARSVQPWSNDEVDTLLGYLGEEETQRNLDGATRNDKVFQGISQRLAAAGYARTTEQCRAKSKKLRAMYKKIKDNNSSSGAGRQDWRWFKAMDSIYGHRPANAGREGSLDSAPLTPACTPGTPVSRVDSSTVCGEGDLSGIAPLCFSTPLPSVSRPSSPEPSVSRSSSPVSGSTVSRSTTPEPTQGSFTLAQRPGKRKRGQDQEAIVGAMRDSDAVFSNTYHRGVQDMVKTSQAHMAQDASLMMDMMQRSDNLMMDMMQRADNFHASLLGLMSEWVRGSRRSEQFTSL
ncbi:hypothetical protein WMY93_027281 [Mugilogobius chulae]|uniref:Myb/SANT-like DNA-binding domain-containing protein n=1 Tax=Mugilogobius chulae TaxID=88201 RepID=A0AAW0MX40_9GOBI